MQFEILPSFIVHYHYVFGTGSIIFVVNSVQQCADLMLESNFMEFLEFKMGFSCKEDVYNLKFNTCKVPFNLHFRLYLSNQSVDFRSQHIIGKGFQNAIECIYWH